MRIYQGERIVPYDITKKLDSARLDGSNSEKQQQERRHLVQLLGRDPQEQDTRYLAQSIGVKPEIAIKDFYADQDHQKITPDRSIKTVTGDELSDLLTTTRVIKPGIRGWLKKRKILKSAHPEGGDKIFYFKEIERNTYSFNITTSIR